MINLKHYQKRRKLFFSYMKNNSLALIFSAPELNSNNNIRYHFYQESNFWYFTGFNEPNSLLIFSKINSKTNVLIFNKSCDVKSKLWIGNYLGQKNAIKILGVDNAFSWEDIKTKLCSLIKNINTIYHAYGLCKKADYYFFYALKKLKLLNSNKYCNLPTNIIDWRPFINKIRSIKTKEEIKILRKAGKISSLAHIRAMKMCKIGINECILEGEIRHEFNINGARFTSYNTIIASGINSLILHYNNNNCKLKNNDLVLIDAACEFQRYACDMTRTFPINGKFNNYQLSIYKIVLRAFYKALSMCRPGIYISTIKKEVIYIIVNDLVKLGILNGEINDLILNYAYKKFYMHNLIHSVGLEVHDVEEYNNKILKKNMVIAVEPGIYIPFDKNISNKYKGIGIRIEDTILITKNGYENLTKDACKNPKEIEFLMKRNY